MKKIEYNQIEIQPNLSHKQTLGNHELYTPPPYVPYLWCLIKQGTIPAVPDKAKEP